MSTILVKIGFFLFELGIAIVSNILFGKDENKNLQEFIKKMESTEKTGEEKYEAVKAYLDSVAKDAPDVIKNIVIEALVAKTQKQTDKILGSIRK